ncbi:F-box protein [Micractinium conductrix]|uniref:F-box protein n=2 Tax=Micractinium conductrix TaxID=554055 RepID=A0A2P6UZT4_9CHLO|nr:F-box protein [Micractinium conductrix]|eukprot:PSC67356.1 F-box protein [Micractinium conductrix]
MEWFMSFYEHRDTVGYTPKECILKEGELLFIPRNWWHVALNLEGDTVAVTQNFVSPANLTHVLAHLRSRSPALVSGCSKASRAGLYDRFVASLRQHRPELLAGVEAAEAAARRKQEEQHKLAELFKAPVAAAASGGNATAHGGAANDSAAGDGAANGVVAAAAAGGGGFSFGFKL